MARVSISKAAQLAGISRTALYKTYIEKGVISVSKDSKNKKYIDTAEIIRVFGEIRVNSEGLQVDSPDNTTEVLTQTEQDFEIKLLRNQLEEARKREQEAQEREGWYKKQIDSLTDTMKLLEAPKHSEPIYPRLWWQFWK